MITDIKDCLISGGNFFEGESAEMTLEQLHEKNPTWATNDMIFGLERLLKSEFQVFPLYKNESEKRKEKDNSERISQKTYGNRNCNTCHRDI